MNPTKFRTLLFAAACAVALSACQRDDETQVSNGQPVPGSVPVQILVGPTRDPSLPDASAVAAQMAADKAREDTLAQSQAPSPADVTPASGTSTLSAQAPEPTKIN
jgi:hypothetical protein